MEKIQELKGIKAKNATRELVQELYYNFISDKTHVEVHSLPEVVWEFEKEVVRSAEYNKLSKLHLYCYESDHRRYDNQYYVMKNWFETEIPFKSRNKAARTYEWQQEIKVFKNHQQCDAIKFSYFMDYMPDDLYCYNRYASEDFHIDKSIMETSKIGSKGMFIWKDYCGLPNNNNCDPERMFINPSFKNTKSVQVFTFELCWRRDDSVPYEMKKLARKYGKREAIVMYFKQLCKDHGYKMMFDIKYKSKKVPMLILAITNDPNLVNPKNLDKIKSQLEEGVKTQKEKEIDYQNTLEVRKELAYSYLKNNVSVDSVAEITGFTPRQVSCFKAWITMTN